jgi:glycosyltransferase involved in cell wall biosynthesis/tetratricopeptide (TPR) repeat protein
MSTHPIARLISKHQKEGATSIKRHGKEVEVEYPPHRIAACMIMGDNVNREDLIRCVESLKRGGIDKLFIAFNGKTRRAYQWFWEHLGRIGLPFLVQKFGWEDDFAKARNQSFEMVPKDEFDWLIWIDSDDELVVETPELTEFFHNSKSEMNMQEWTDTFNLAGKNALTEMLESLDPYTQGVYLRYDYAFDPETSKVAVVQWRERILSTKVSWQWVFPVHEVVFSPANTQFARKHEVYIKHHRKVKETDSAARIRNRKIIAKSLKENPNHPRMQFYLGNEAMAEAEDAIDPNEKGRLAGAAILAYKRFLSNEVAQKEDLYMAAVRVGDLHLMRFDTDSAVDAYLNALKIIPDAPDAYIGLARAAMEAEDWKRCMSFCNIALKMETPVTPGVTTPLTHQYTPLLLRGMANQGLGNYADAQKDYLAAKEVYNPPNGMLEDRLTEIERKIAVTSQDKDLRKSLRGKRPEKSIAFVTAPIVEPWHPELEKYTGAGGAETAIMRLAPRFAADGWRTVVFGTPGDHRGIDEHGVEWWNSMEFLPNEEFSVLIASRTPEIFEAEIAAKKKLLWMHDVNVGPRLFPFLERIDTVVGLTNWHVNHMSHLYQTPISKFNIVPNGIELDLYYWGKRQESDDELRMIWSSSPDRGLGTLVSLWPAIKSMYPTARLDVFYGWNIIDKLIAKTKNPYYINLKQKILGNIAMLGGEEAGIHQHGRISQRELSTMQMAAHIWPYPTDFMETFCITAIEMQAAGVIPVTSDLAALSENVANKELLVKGWPLNRDYQTRWIKTLENVVEGGDEKQTQLQASGRAFAEQFSWDAAYTKWNDLFGRMSS